MITIEFAKQEHLEGIHLVELESFSIPWSKYDLQKDIFENAISIYVVALDSETVVGYAGMWHVVTEGHITNLAVKENYRQQGVASRLVERLIAIAEEKEMIGLTLECRISNTKAQRLYKKHGFEHEGLRKKYYSDTGEDATIMWKHF